MGKKIVIGVGTVVATVILTEIGKKIKIDPETVLEMRVGRTVVNLSGAGTLRNVIIPKTVITRPKVIPKAKTAAVVERKGPSLGPANQVWPVKGMTVQKESINS